MCVSKLAAVDGRRKARFAGRRVSNPRRIAHANENLSGADEGAARMMMHLHHQFDMIDAQSDMNDYEMLVLPDRVALDVGMIKRLSEFVKKGGALLASGFSGVSEDGHELLLASFRFGRWGFRRSRRPTSVSAKPFPATFRRAIM